MKKFVSRVVLFGLLVAVLIGGVCLAEIVADIRRYHAAIVAPPEASVLVCGDSQAGNGIVSTECSLFFNRSAHGRTLDQSYLTMLDVVEHNPRGRIKVVVFDVTPPAAVTSLCAPLVQMGQPAMYWLLHYLHPRENIRSLDGGLRVVRDDLVEQRIHHLSRALRGKLSFRSSLEAEFPSFDFVGKTLDPDRYWSMVRAKARSCMGLRQLTTTSPFVVEVLDKVVAYAKENDIRVLFITTPWSEDLRQVCTEAEMDAFSSVMREFASSRSCEYVDFLRLHFDEGCWRDGNHLNCHGAKLFTQLVADEIKKRKWL